MVQSMPPPLPPHHKKNCDSCQETYDKGFREGHMYGINDANAGFHVVLYFLEHPDRMEYLDVKIEDYKREIVRRRGKEYHGN